MKTAAKAPTRFQMAPGDTTVESRPKSRASASMMVVLPLLLGPTKTAWRPSATSAERTPRNPEIFRRMICTKALARFSLQKNP